MIFPTHSPKGRFICQHAKIKATRHQQDQVRRYASFVCARFQLSIGLKFNTFVNDIPACVYPAPTHSHWHSCCWRSAWRLFLEASAVWRACPVRARAPGLFCALNMPSPRHTNANEIFLQRNNTLMFQWLDLFWHYFSFGLSPTPPFQLQIWRLIATSDWRRCLIPSAACSRSNVCSYRTRSFTISRNPSEI